MRKLMDWLYPRYDEISVFLMTLIIVTSVAIDNKARGLVLYFLTQVLPAEPVGALVLAVGILIVVGSALLLPLTRTDLRGFAFFMIVVHTLTVTAANVTWALAGKGDPRWHALNWIFVCYSLSWLVVLRYRPATDVISDRQAHPREALYAGAACVALILVAVKILSIPWVYAYSMAFVAISTLHDAGLALFQRLERGPDTARNRIH